MQLYPAKICFRSSHIDTAEDLCGGATANLKHWFFFSLMTAAMADTSGGAIHLFILVASFPL